MDNWNGVLSRDGGSNARLHTCIVAHCTTLEGEEESRLHGDGQFSSGVDMTSSERIQFGVSRLENPCSFMIEWSKGK